MELLDVTIYADRAISVHNSHDDEIPVHSTHYFCCWYLVREYAWEIFIKPWQYASLQLAENNAK